MTSPQTKLRQDPYTILRNKFCNYSRVRLVVSIKPSSLRKVKSNLKYILSARNTIRDVSSLITDVNNMLIGTVNYFGHFQNVRRQLKQLDHLIYLRF